MPTFIKICILVVCSIMAMSAVADKSVVGSDGITYHSVMSDHKFVYPRHQVEVKKSECTYTRVDWLHNQEVCTGSETIVGTEEGRLEKVFTESISGIVFRSEVATALLCILLVGVGMVLQSRGHPLSAVAFFLSMITAVLGFVSIVTTSVIIAVLIALSAITTASVFNTRAFRWFATVTEIILVVGFYQLVVG